MTTELTVEGFENAVRIGWGGFADVFRAWQTTAHRDVAVKVLSVHPSTDLTDRLRRECAAIGALSGHPNVVSVHEVGSTPDGRPFIVMEYLHGGSLADRLRAEGPLNWPEAAEIGVKLSGALATAHGVGVLHRDVKPENVLVSQFGQPKLGDFGIAQLSGAPPESSGGVVGSLPHAAPEVLAGGSPTVASDVYSLGSTLFTVLSGTPPFGFSAGDDPALFVHRVATEPVPDLRDHGVPDELCRVVERALAKDPADRPASAAELGRELQEVLADTDLAVPTIRLGGVTPAAPRDGPRVRWPSVAMTVGVVLALVTVLVRSLADGKRPGSPTAPVSTTAAAAVTTTVEPRRTIFREDFSRISQWLTIRDPEGVANAAVVDGHYRMASVPPAGLSLRLPLAHAPIQDSPSRYVLVEVDATKTTTGPASYGVVCGGPESPFPYGALIDSNGYWLLIEVQDRGRWVELGSGGRPAAIQREGVNRLALECREDAGGALLTFSVNGTRVTGAKQAKGPANGPGAGLMLVARGEPTEVLFDNFSLTYS